MNNTQTNIVQQEQILSPILESKVKIQNIPHQLKELKQWVLWRYETKADGSRTKVPYNANADFSDANKKASSTNPATWSSFLTACRMLATYFNEYDGIGFCLRLGSGIVGADGDKIKDTPKWNDMLSTLDTYAEISPSGVGLRFFGFGDLPFNGRKHESYEIYQNQRFLTITGNVINGHTEMKNVQTGIDAAVANWFPAQTKKERELSEPHITIEDEQIVALGMEHDRSGRFAALWNYDESKLIEFEYVKEDGSVDRSKCHFALLVKLAFYTRDHEQLERLLMACEMRDHDKLGRSKYVARTIERAVETQEERYRPPTTYIMAEQLRGIVTEWPDAEVVTTVVADLVEPDGVCFGEDYVDTGRYDGREDEPVEDPSLDGGRHVSSVAAGGLGDTYDGLEMLRRAKATKTTYLFDGLFETGVINLITGLPYSGKTIFVLQMIRALVLGIDLYGHKCNHPQTPVLYINADGCRDKQFLRRLLDICKGDETELFQILPHIHYTETDRLPHTITAEWLEPIVEAMKAKFSVDKVTVVIDTLRPAFLNEAGAGAENDPGIMTKLLSPIRKMADRSGCPVLILHHNNRARDDYSGSAAIVGVTDAVWTVKKSENGNDAEIDIKNRDLGPSKLFIKLGTLDDDISKVVVPFDPLKEFIEHFPTDSTKALTRDEALAMFATVDSNNTYHKISERELVRKIEESERAGVHPRLEKVGGGKKGDPFRYFAV